MTTTADLSKLNAYAVLSETGPEASKIVAYAVLVTNNVDERATATDTTDAGVGGNPDVTEAASATDATDAFQTEDLSKLVGYAVLSSTGADASKVNAYAVLQGTPEVDEAASATDTTDATFVITTNPSVVEIANARDATNASFSAAGSGGPVRASQVVMEVLLPAKTTKVRPFVWINT